MLCVYLLEAPRRSVSDAYHYIYIYGELKKISKNCHQILLLHYFVKCRKKNLYHNHFGLVLPTNYIPVISEPLIGTLASLSLNLYHSMGIISKWQIDDSFIIIIIIIIFFFYRKQVLIFHANCQFAWNIESYFLEINEESISICRLLKIFSRVLRVNTVIVESRYSRLSLSRIPRDSLNHF